MLTACSHPKLINCRRLFLRNYQARINIGVHNFEKFNEQRVLINIDLFVPLALSTSCKDKLSEVVDYEFMHTTVAQHISQGHIHLQETLCDNIVRAMLKNPQVLAARVSIGKLDVYPNCDAVGVEVFLMKED